MFFCPFNVLQYDYFWYGLNVFDYYFVYSYKIFHFILELTVNVFVLKTSFSF